MLFLGFHLSALGGSYCDHGNKLMWGYYSSRTGTFFYIQLHSRNANHKLGINEKFFFHNQKNPVKRHKPRFYSPSKARRQLSKRKQSKIQPRLPSFQREFQFLCWRTLTYFNICMDQHLRNDEEDFDTQTSGSTYAPAHWKRKYFSDWTKKERDSRGQFETATYTFFNQWKIICS